MGPVALAPLVPLVPYIVAAVGTVGTVVGAAVAIKIHLNKKQKQQREFIQRQNKKWQEEMKRRLANDPKNYVQVKEQVFEKFLESLENYKWESKIDKQPRTIYHMIIGKVSAGKSSLLNQVFNKQLVTGVGDTTKQVTCIGQHTYEDFQKTKYTTRIFDTPGFNDQFTAYNAQMLVLIRDMDKVFICYKNTLKDVEDLLKILKKIKLNKSSIVLIRTQCDQFDQVGLKRTLDQELEVDQKYLKQNIKLQCEICAHSSKKGQSFRDYVKIEKLLKNIPLQ